MNSKKIIAIFAMLIGIATTAVFVGCKKDDNVVEQRKDALKKQKEHVKIYIAQWDLDHAGEGKGKDKTCTAEGNLCVLWIRHNLEEGMEGYIAVEYEGLEKPTSIVSDPAPENREFPKRILVEFPNEWNTNINLDNFLGGGNEFVVNEDIIEGEDSYLLEMLGIDDPCVIKAGEYPMYMNGEGNYVIEFMVDRISLDFDFWGRAIKLKIGDQDQLSSTYSDYSEFSEVSDRTGYVIYAEFLSEWNDNPDAINIMESIRDNGGLDVNEDIIVDEDSYLFEVFPYPCVIRAGRYPVYTEDNENFVICFAVEPL